MDRRELIGSALAVSAVSALASRSLLGAVPCQPSSLFVDGAPVSKNCGNPGTAPTWFLNMQDGTWAQVAGGTGQRITDQLQSPRPTNQYNPSANGIVTAWTGGAVDQTRREYILCAGGGHADYCGNEAYGLSLGDSVPAWRRLSDSTPSAQMGSVDNPGTTYADGRPRAMHATNQCFGDGRVWFPMMCSVVSGSGGHADQVVSYNRESLGAASSPLPWTSSNLGPWALHGSSNQNTSTFGFGYGVFDPVNHRVYGIANGSGSFGIWWWRFNSQGANVGVSTAYNNQSLHIVPCWAVCAPDLGIIVVGGQAGTINVLNIASNTWSRPTNVAGTGFFANHGGSGASGSCYVAANSSIAICDTSLIGGRIYRLRIPTSGGSYDPAGQWAWDNWVPGGVTVPVASDSRGDFSKWNIIENMGNGQSAIVIVGGIATPTYVYKIPAAGLNPA